VLWQSKLAPGFASGWILVDKDPDPGRNTQAVKVIGARPALDSIQAHNQIAGNFHFFSNEKAPGVSRGWGFDLMG